MTAVVGTGTVVAGDTFDITTTATFADGVHTFVAQETNNPDPNLPESQPFTVDVDPNAPSITTLVGQPVNGGTVELKGTGERRATPSIFMSDGNAIRLSAAALSAPAAPSTSRRRPRSPTALTLHGDRDRRRP